MYFLISMVDYFYQKKKNSFLKTKLPKKIDVFFDIGSHYCQTIQDLYKNFYLKNVYAFEPSKKNFIKLKKKVDKLKTKYVLSKINIYPYGVGKSEEVLFLNEISDGESNTFNDLNINSNYFKKKKFILTLFGLKKFFQAKTPTKIISLKQFIKEEKINKIDFIKIDTEGYEYNALLGLEDEIRKVKFILFEHHYDNMIIKNYKFKDIHKLLIENDFERIFKTKMPFRKSFDYIYKNKN